MTDYIIAVTLALLLILLIWNFRLRKKIIIQTKELMENITLPYSFIFSFFLLRQPIYSHGLFLNYFISLS